MTTTAAKITEEWFARHNNDGEFACLDRSSAYSVIVPPQASSAIIYATKPRTVAQAFELPAADDYGMIGRYGLPEAADVPFLAGFVRGREVLFLGDLDPVDLMVFVWLRETLPATTVRWLGISDRYLAALGISNYSWLRIPLSDSEIAALAISQVIFPDMRETIGNACAELLLDNQKLELEGIVAAKNSFELLPSIAASSE